MSEKIKMVIVQRAHGVSPQFFKIKTRVPNHNKYVEIKQFSEKTSNKKYFYRYFLNQVSCLSMRLAHLQGSLVVNIFIYIMKFVFI